MKLSKREKILVIVVLAIAVTAAYFFLFYQPCMDEKNKLVAQNKTNQGIIQTNQILKKSIEVVTQGLIDNENKLAEFRDNVNSAFDQPPVLVYLYNTMSANGDKITIDFDSSGNLGLVKYNKINITMKGTYEGLKNIMKEFSEGEYFIKVIYLSATVPPKLPGTGTATDGTDTTEGSFSDNLTTVDDNTPTNIDDRLDITMELEFYNVGDSIPPDKTYDFTGGAVQYGGDMFGY